MDYAVRVSHYVDPATFELQRDVILLISGAHVVETIEGGEVSGGLAGLAEHTLEFDNALCLPGFVNCHTHLDLSHLHRQVPRGLKFHEWAPAVIAGRAMPQSMIDAGIDDACRMLVASGTTAVLDISVGGDAAKYLSKHGLRGIIALEVLGWSGDAAEKSMARADEIARRLFSDEHDRLGEEGQSPFSKPASAGSENGDCPFPGVDYGLSPHAPYSTSMELYQHAFGRAFGDGRVCTTHVAESLEEEEFIRDGKGPLRELLAMFGIDLSSFTGYGQTPLSLVLDWLGPWLPGVTQLRGQFPTAGTVPTTAPLVLVHCNYAREVDFARLAESKPSVCWCPRSHAWFGHEQWPLAQMREAGVNLVIGTDSLASNDGLDMLGELRLAARHPDADVAELFKAATVNGRRALGIEADAADLAIWGIQPGANTRDELLRGMLANETPLYASFSRGNLIARAV